MKEYVKYEIENTVQIDYLVSCFEMTYDRTFTFSGETHDFWEFVYVADGAVGVTAGDRVAELGKGQIIFHQPMEFHRIWSIQDTTPHVVIMSFGAQGEGMDHYKNGIFRLDQREENYLWKILKQAARIFDGFQVRPQARDRHAAQYIRCWLELLLLSIQDCGQAVRLGPRSSGAMLYHDVVEYMQEHLGEKLTLDDIARSCGTSVSTMKNLFRRYAGEGAIQYFNRMKLGEAKRLICSGLSMAEVSAALGFSSQNYFSAFFKQLTGVTPSAFAAVCQEDGEKGVRI